MFFAFAMFIPETLMRIYTPEPELIEIGASYLRAVAFSYLFSGITNCYYLMMKLEGKAVKSVYISVDVYKRQPIWREQINDKECGGGYRRGREGRMNLQQLKYVLAIYKEGSITKAVAYTHLDVYKRQIVSRNVNAFHPSLLSVTRIQAGNTWNVIPETAELEGTVRTMDKNDRELYRERLRQIACLLYTSLLADAGWDGSQTLRFYVNSGDSTFVNAATVMVAQWAAVGIKAEVQTVDFATLMSVAGTRDYDILAVQYTYCLLYTSRCV